MPTLPGTAEAKRLAAASGGFHRLEESHLARVSARLERSNFPASCTAPAFALDEKCNIEDQAAVGREIDLEHRASVKDGRHRRRGHGHNEKQKDPLPSPKRPTKRDPLGCSLRAVRHDHPTSTRAARRDDAHPFLEQLRRRKWRRSSRPQPCGNANGDSRASQKSQNPNRQRALPQALDIVPIGKGTAEGFGAGGFW